MNFKRFWKWQYAVPAAIVAAPILIGLIVLFFGGIVMLLWNWLLPPLFDFPRIDIWQGFGLFILGRLLFGGFGGSGGHGGRHARRMTPEERERMRRRFCRRKDGDPTVPPDGADLAQSG